MPEYLRTDAPDWDRRRDWATVREDLEALRKAGEDWGAFSVRTSAEEGDEERADCHPDTRTLFSLVSPEVPARADSGPPAEPRPAHGLGRLRDAVERMNAGADYSQHSDRRRQLIAEWLTTGADPAPRDPKGWTLLHFAAVGSWGPEMVAALAEAGGAVDARDADGRTPLHLAARYGSSEMAKALGAAGADVNARNEDGWTPLHLVARYDGPAAVAAALLAAGAEPDLRTGDGWTALLLAAAMGGPELVESILAAGPDVGARNGAGATALDVANALQRPADIIAALRAAGAPASGGSRDRGAPRAEPRFREEAATTASAAGRPWSAAMRSSPGGSAGVQRVSSRTADSPPRRVAPRTVPAPSVRRPSRYWRWMGALAAVAAVVIVLANLGDESSSPSTAEDVAPVVVAAPVEEGASPPADGGGPTREEEAALTLDGSARQRIQRGLSAAGFEPGPADGVFAAGTRDAIRAWQTERGFPATGYLNAAAADELGELGDADRTYASAEPGGGRLTVRAAPASRIELDGADVGATGATGLLLLSGIQPGRHVVVARKQGYAEATSVVEVLEGRAEVVELTLAALEGRLTVTANVSDARLRIEGAGDHRLPLSGLEVPAGSHRVTVSREGFRSVEAGVEIRPDELTTLDLVLEPVSVEVSLQAALDEFGAGNYREAAEGARLLLDLRPDAGAAHLLLGKALYELGRFDESTGFLGRAIELGEEVVLPANHRHGGAGLREGFCRGTITLSRNEIAYLSGEQPDHGFSVTPDKVTDLEVSERIDGSAFRLNTRVEDEVRGIRRRNFDFVHRNAARIEPDSSLLTCPGCDASLNLQVALMNYLTRLAR